MYSAIRVLTRAGRRLRPWSSTRSRLPALQYRSFSSKQDEADEEERLKQAGMWEAMKEIASSLPRANDGVNVDWSKVGIKKIRELSKKLPQSKTGGVDWEKMGVPKGFVVDFEDDGNVVDMKKSELPEELLEHIPEGMHIPDRLPLGLTNSPEEDQTVVDAMLGKVPDEEVNDSYLTAERMQQLWNRLTSSHMYDQPDVSELSSLVVPRRRLGLTKHPLSIVGLGCMRLSIDGRPSHEDAISVIHEALDLGVNHFDTADVYCLGEDDIGHNELLIKEALSTYVDEHGADAIADVIVATKGGMSRPGGEWIPKGSPDDLRRACEASLRRLDVDKLPLYYLHAPDPTVPYQDQLEAMASLQADGLIEHIGLSNVTLENLHQALKMGLRVEAIQNRMNIEENDDVSTGILLACQQHQMSYVSFCPLGGTGAIREQLIHDPGNVSYGELMDCTVEEFAIWCILQFSPQIVAIPGCSRVETLRSAVRSAHLKGPHESIREAVDERQQELLAEFMPQPSEEQLQENVESVAKFVKTVHDLANNASARESTDDPGYGRYAGTNPLTGGMRRGPEGGSTTGVGSGLSMEAEVDPVFDGVTDPRLAFAEGGEKQVQLDSTFAEKDDHTESDRLRDYSQLGLSPEEQEFFEQRFAGKGDVVNVDVEVDEEDDSKSK